MALLSLVSPSKISFNLWIAHKHQVSASSGDDGATWCHPLPMLMMSSDACVMTEPTPACMSMAGLDDGAGDVPELAGADDAASICGGVSGIASGPAPGMTADDAADDDIPGGVTGVRTMTGDSAIAPLGAKMSLSSMSSMSLMSPRSLS
jgi:hypothetical protein